MRFLVLLASLYLVGADPRLDHWAMSMTRVVGGSDAAIEDFPWQLSMEFLGSHSCGAVAVGSNWALTAAHCIDGRNPGQITIKAGLTDRNQNSNTYQTLSCNEIIKHEGYGVSTPDPGVPNDIAILVLAGDFQLSSSVALIPMASDANEDFTGADCQISGWGRTGTSQALPNTLQYVDVNVISSSDCNSEMSNVIGGQVFDSHICLYDPQGNYGSCNGDSGGPMNCRRNSNDEYLVAGITSWGVSSGGNCLQTYPSVYTRVSYHIDWVNDNSP